VATTDATKIKRNIQFVIKTKAKECDRMTGFLYSVISSFH